MLRIRLRLNAMLVVLIAFNRCIWGNDINYSSNSRGYVTQEVNGANNRRPMSFNKFKALVSRDGWRVISPPPATNNGTVLLTPRRKRDFRLVFHWTVIPDKKLQLFNQGLHSFQFESIRETSYLTKSYSLRSGETISRCLWQSPVEIRFPGSFTIGGPIRVMEYEQRLIKLVQETLDEVEDGHIINTWFTENISTVEFVREKKGDRKTKGVGVRREKASIFSGCNSHPARGRSSR